MTLRKPYLIFLGKAEAPSFAKTGFDLRDWAPEDCTAQLRLTGCNADLGLRDMDTAEAAAAGAPDESRCPTGKAHHRIPLRRSNG